METTSALRTPSNDEIPDLLTDHAASGQTLAAFARERGLTTWKLYPAARQQARSTSRSRPRASKVASFAPVSVVGSRAQAYELDLGAKGVLKIPAGFDAGDLRQLLEVLRAC